MGIAGGLWRVEAESPPGFLLNPDPQAGILFERRFRFE